MRSKAISNMEDFLMMIYFPLSLVILIIQEEEKLVRIFLRACLILEKGIRNTNRRGLN